MKLLEMQILFSIKMLSFVNLRIFFKLQLFFFFFFEPELKVPLFSGGCGCVCMFVLEKGWGQGWRAMP